MATKGTWGLKVAAWLDPRKVGYGLPLAVFTELFWLVLVPFGGVALYFLAMWRCTGARAHVQPLVAEAFPAPPMPHPTMVERIIIPDEAAAQRGLPPGTIVERIHYRRKEQRWRSFARPEGRRRPPGIMTSARHIPGATVIR